jgi:hypothetical protein
LQVFEGVAHELLRDKYVFVLDSKAVVDSFDSSQVDESKRGLLFLIVCITLPLIFQNFNVCFVKRQTNMVAHTLARVAANQARAHFFYFHA